LPLTRPPTTTGVAGFILFGGSGSLPLATGGRWRPPYYISTY
jgi:hypothetical protein